MKIQIVKHIVRNMTNPGSNGNGWYEYIDIYNDGSVRTYSVPMGFRIYYPPKFFQDRFNRIGYRKGDRCNDPVYIEERMAA